MESNLLNRLLAIEEGESGRVILLLIISFFMGSFLATFSVAAQTIFLTRFTDNQSLAIGFMLAGGFGVVATFIYNFFQTRVPFRVLGVGSLIVVTIITAAIEFGENYVPNTDYLIWFGFAQQVPFALVILLLFWGAFNRLFNVRQSKRLLGSVDQGALLASIISFFAIPLVLNIKGFLVEDLYTISLVSIIVFTVLFYILSTRFGGQSWSLKTERAANKKLNVIEFFQNKYVVYLSLFIIISVVALNFVDYTFLTSSTQYYSGPRLDYLPTFLSYFEMTVVIFSFLFQTFAADKIMEDYGLKVSILVNPVLLGIFTVAALVIGVAFGYTTESAAFVVFFIMIAVSKLFLMATKESLDEPAFKLYQLPVDTNIKIDVQTKIEGIVTAFATILAGALIYAVNQLDFVDLLYIVGFTVPIIVGWYLVGNNMYSHYRHTLRDTLIKNKAKVKAGEEREYTVDRVLAKEVNSTTEDKVVYGLRLMENLEPALFENAVIRLTESNSARVRSFAEDRIRQLGIEPDDGQSKEIRNLARQAKGESEDGDLLSISPDKLLKLSKSIKPADRMLAAKLLRKLISQRTIFILLELLRDVDYKVRSEALTTARKLKRPETWTILIELLSSASYGRQAAAGLIEAGDAALPYLEAAFHKSGQTDLNMLRIVQIMGRIGGDQAMDLLWKKADYPDKRIVKQILYSLRMTDYKATGRQAREVTDLLETELGKTLWNLAALSELPSGIREFELLRSAVREEIRSNFDQVTMLLSILYDPEAVRLVRENIDSGDPNGVAYALELMDLFVDQDLKPKLFPLFDDISIERKLDELQVYFPRENYNPIQVINYILNRDFNMNNRWTKVCAIHTSAYLKDFRVSRGLIAQMFNKDKLLQETAAWVIYNKDRQAYETITKRLPHRDKGFLDSAIENNQLLDGLNDGFFLGIEMVLFLKELAPFKNISGVLLSDLFDKITPLDLMLGEKFAFDPTLANSPIFIVAHGEVKLKLGDAIQAVLKPGDIYGDIFEKSGRPFEVDHLEAAERSVVFKIDHMDFYFVLANHYELVEGFIKNITEATKVD